MFTVEGSVQPGYEAVERAFRDNFELRGEVGAAACAWRNGERVVDLWGGLANREREEAWNADSLVVTFSCTKGLVALCLLMLADRGKLDYDRPVVDYWPEFGAGGKQHVSVRDLLNHRSGLVAIDRPLSLAEWADPETVSAALANQEPQWRPGSDQGYGAVTTGAYAAELFRRIAGRSVGSFFSDEVAGPLGADVFIGLPAELSLRVATLYPARLRSEGLGLIREAILGRTVEGRLLRSLLQRRSLTRRAFGNPDLGRRGLQVFNAPQTHALEIPWAGAIASARGLAKVYAALAGGGGMLCRSESIEPLTRRQSWSECDRVMRKPLGFSQGFLKDELHVFAPGAEAFGHPGMGGALGLADSDHGLAFAYVMNRMDLRVRSPRC
ncbi:MAG: serine hydrolase domain-containing protein, partial [Myxococcota bacterium]